MKRRDFIRSSGMGLGAVMGASIPIIGHAVSIEQMLEPKADAAMKKNWQMWPSMWPNRKGPLIPMCALAATSSSIYSLGKLGCKISSMRNLTA